MNIYHICFIIQCIHLHGPEGCYATWLGSTLAQAIERSKLLINTLIVALGFVSFLAHMTQWQLRVCCLLQLTTASLLCRCGILIELVGCHHCQCFDMVVTENVSECSHAFTLLFQHINFLGLVQVKLEPDAIQCSDLAFVLADKSFLQLPPLPLSACEFPSLHFQFQLQTAWKKAICGFPHLSKISQHTLQLAREMNLTLKEIGVTSMQSLYVFFKEKVLHQAFQRRSPCQLAH